MLFLLHIFSFLSFFFVKKKNKNTKIFTFLQQFSQCEAKRLNRLGVTGPTSCRCVWFPVIVSDFIENVCVIFQHVSKSGKVKACPCRKLSWCVMACLHTHNETGAQHRHYSMTPWPLCLPLLSSFVARFQKFCCTKLQQNFPLCPQQLLRKAESGGSPFHTLWVLSSSICVIRQFFQLPFSQ